MKNFPFLFLFALSLAACRDDDDGAFQPDEGEQYSGGANFTTFDFSENAFGVQGKNLGSDTDNLFVSGNSLFRTNWVTAPASVQSLDGLGPVFNAISCGSCHFKDGRAAPPNSSEDALNGLLFRLSVPGQGTHGAPLGDPTYGGQLQDKAILGVQSEAKVRVVYEEISGSYADGETWSLRRPHYEFFGLNFGDFAPGMTYSPRIAQQIPGLGLLENVPEAAILEFADENDGNGDGISGRPNYVWDVALQQTVLGRFGWKANQPNLRQQTAGAFNGDIGITSSLFPDDHLTPAQLALYPGLPNGGSPELSDEQLLRVVIYIKTLSVPARRNWEAQEVLLGKAVFKQLNCASCHRPDLLTGNGNSIPALDGQSIHPYTDLLLHDMGDGLADNRPDFLATGNEWRTPPLWGIGMVQTVNGHTNFLHDGRARNLEEAILWHGGEAEASKLAFTKRSKKERQALLTFLESL
jgi:CxxC motif-containing protein (DUF1111 family)